MTLDEQVMMARRQFISVLIEWMPQANVDYVLNAFDHAVADVLQAQQEEFTKVLRSELRQVGDELGAVIDSLREQAERRSDAEGSGPRVAGGPTTTKEEHDG